MNTLSTITHHTTPSYYQVDAVCTTDFSRNKSHHGIKATGPLDAVHKLEQRLGFKFDSRWKFLVHRKKNLSRSLRAMAKLERQSAPRSPWAALARYAKGPRKSFTHHFNHNLNLAYECIMDRAMR